MLTFVTIPPINVGATIPVEFDFTDDLQTGETIVTPLVALTILSGTDATPNTNFFSTVATSGALVTQRVRPVSTSQGNIYTMTCTVETNLGNVYLKAGFLAVPPVTLTTFEPTVPSSTVAEYDSGNVTTQFSPTPVLLSGDNSGGLFTINTYINVSIAGASGTISLTVYWTDNVTGSSNSRTAGTVQAGATNNSGTTFAIDSRAGTQVLLSTTFNTVVGTPTYNATMSVSRP